MRGYISEGSILTLWYAVELITCITSLKKKFKKKPIAPILINGSYRIEEYYIESIHS